MNSKNLLKNDDAVSISLGFILIFSITVLVFSAIILSFYTLTQHSERAATQESFDIMGSGPATRIITIDTLVNITGSYGGTVNNLEYEFSIPSSIADESYFMNITGSQIILESDNGAKAWVPFNVSTGIGEREIYSSAQDYKLLYNRTDNKIEIKEQ